MHESRADFAKPPSRMSKTIDEHQFRKLCREVRADAPMVLRGVSEPSRKTQYLLRVLFERVCRYLEIDARAQSAELGDDNGFALFQTLEEHMDPEFSYNAVLDSELLFALDV
jgi:hypothetical protein